MGKKKTKTTTNETATRTPNVPSYAQGPINNYYAQVGNIMGSDPYSYTTPANDLHMQAAAGAANLGGWRDGLGASNDLAMGAAGAPANTAQWSSYTPASAGTAQGYDAPQVGRTRLGSPSLFGGAQVGAAPQTEASLFGGTRVGAAPQGSAIGFTAPQMGAAQGYNASQLGPAPQINSQGYQASLAGPVQIGPAALAGNVSLGNGPSQAADVTIAPAVQATAQQAQRVDATGLIGGFQNPYTQQVVNATLADFDENAGRARAAQAANAARSGAFGGSRYAIREAQTEGELARARASTQAGLLSSGYDRAVSAALQQAGLDTGINSLNAQLGTQVSQGNASEANATARAQGDISARIGLGNAQMGNEWSIAQGGINRDIALGNAGFLNSRNIAQGQIDRDIGVSNSQLGSRASEMSAGWANDALRANQDVAARYGLDQAGRNDVASQFTAAAGNAQRLAQGQMDYGAAAQSNENQNRFSLTNLGLQGQYGLAQAGFDQETGIANQQARQQTNLASMDMQGRYGLAQAGFYQQAGLANMDTNNNFALTQGQMDQQRNFTQAGLDAGAAEFGADWGNRFRLDGAARADAASQYTAGAFNQNQEFNAGQYDEGLARQLQAAGLLGTNANAYAGNSINDINAQLGAGGTLWDIQNQYNQAPLNVLGAYGSLLNPSGTLNTVTGQTINSSGTSITKEKKGLLGELLKAGAQVASAAAMSERRVKRDIELLGREGDGLGVYRYNYVWDAADEPARTGVMVDEVETLRPWALGPVKDGIQTVDYSKLEAA